MAEIVNKERLSKILGISARTLTEYQKEGMPIEKEGKRGQSNTYDTAKVIEWLVKRAADSTGEMDKAKLRLAIAQANKAELEVEEMQGDLIPLEKMKAMWAGVLATCRARILSMPTRLAPVLINTKDPKKVEKVVRDACHEALNELAAYDPEANKERKADGARSRKRTRASTAA